VKRGRPRHDDVLTPREWQVLDLIREGLTNEAIAERLAISLDTAKFHVSEILTKLGLSTRQEAARWQGRPKRRLGWLPLTFRWPSGVRAVAAILVFVVLLATAALLTGVFSGPSADRDNSVLPGGAVDVPGAVALKLSVCIDNDTWQKPTLEEQAAHVNVDRRYAPFNAQLQSEFEARFWAPPAGASPVGTIILFSGLWTEGESVVASALNTGCPSHPDVNHRDLAEIWLLGYDAAAASWDNDHLVVKVTSKPAGYQVVQLRFPGPTTDYGGPIEFVDASGMLVGRIDGNTFSSHAP
jgi:DNA-binding CsgD family transcriptional regulator